MIGTSRVRDHSTRAVRWPSSRPVASVVGLMVAATMAGPVPAEGSEPVTELAVRLVDPSDDIAVVAGDHGATEVRPMVPAHGLWGLTVHDQQVQDALDDDPRVRWTEIEDAGALPTSSHRTWAWLDEGSGAAASHRTWAWLDEATVHPAEVFTDQPAATTIGLGEAHRTSRGAGTTVAILDTGVDADHPAFGAQVADGGWDLIGDDDRPDDAAAGSGRAAGHGTHVAGLVHLVAPEASLLPFRVLDADGVGSLARTILAIELAVESGADVINLSFGTTAESDVLEDVIDAAQEAGVVVVAAVGNRGADVEEYPARLDDVVAVAAVDATDTAAPFTSDGDWVDVAAPGVDLLGPYPGGRWASWSGTSMAAPLVAGQAALLGAVDGRRSPDAIVDLIDESTVEVTRLGSAIGEGRIDVAGSLTLLLED
jgi:subtilisin family serine protease